MEWTHIIHTCKACGASWHVPKDEPHECAVVAAREKALSDAFEALMAEEFDGGISYVFGHWTTYKGAAQFLARKFGLRSSEQSANAPASAAMNQTQGSQEGHHGDD